MIKNYSSHFYFRVYKNNSHASILNPLFEWFQVDANIFNEQRFIRSGEKKHLLLLQSGLPLKSFHYIQSSELWI